MPWYWKPTGVLFDVNRTASPNVDPTAEEPNPEPPGPKAAEPHAPPPEYEPPYEPPRNGAPQREEPGACELEAEKGRAFADVGREPCATAADTVRAGAAECGRWRAAELGRIAQPGAPCA
eukprot:5876950-Prymnesium_polylepis.1